MKNRQLRLFLQDISMYLSIYTIIIKKVTEDEKQAHQQATSARRGVSSRSSNMCIYDDIYICSHPPYGPTFSCCVIVRWFCFVCLSVCPSASLPTWNHFPSINKNPIWRPPPFQFLFEFLSKN